MSTYFPSNFPDIGGWDFEKTWKGRREWCLFSQKWTTATGLFKLFKDFVKQKLKEEKNATCCKRDSN